MDSVERERRKRDGDKSQVIVFSFLEEYVSEADVDKDERDSFKELVFADSKDVKVAEPERDAKDIEGRWESSGTESGDG